MLGVYVWYCSLIRSICRVLWMISQDMSLGGTYRYTNKLNTDMLKQCLQCTLGYGNIDISMQNMVIISMAQCKTAVSPLLTHWRYWSLALSHQSNIDKLWYHTGADNLLWILRTIRDKKINILGNPIFNDIYIYRFHRREIQNNSTSIWFNKIQNIISLQSPLTFNISKIRSMKQKRSRCSRCEKKTP